MTKEQVKLLLPVIQAFAEGEKIQSRSTHDDAWRDVTPNQSISFGLGVENYRIKPPEKFYKVGQKFVFTPTGKVYILSMVDKNKMVKLISLTDGWRWADPQNPVQDASKITEKEWEEITGSNATDFKLKE